MDYINYWAVKQSPMQGMTGLWGGTQGTLLAGVSGPGDPQPLDYAGGRALLSSQGNAIVNYWDLTTTANAGTFGTIPSNQAGDNAALCGNSGNRAVWGGGTSGENAMVYVTTTSTSNTSTFGSMQSSRYAPAGCSNGPRGLIAAGSTPSDTNSIEYITVASTSSSADFGDRTVVRHGIDSVSGGVRGIFANGQSPSDDTIDYVTISSTGNATEFGNTVGARTFGCGTNSDPGSGQNRGVFMAGLGWQNSGVDYITCSTTGNATDWGELNTAHSYRAGSGSDGITGYCGAGAGGSDNISYLTIDTTGSSTDAGELAGSGDSGGTSGKAS